MKLSVTYRILLKWPKGHVARISKINAESIMDPCGDEQEVHGSLRILEDPY